MSRSRARCRAAIRSNEPSRRPRIGRGSSCGRRVHQHRAGAIVVHDAEITAKLASPKRIDACAFTPGGGRKSAAAAGGISGRPSASRPVRAWLSTRAAIITDDERQSERARRHAPGRRSPALASDPLAEHWSRPSHQARRVRERRDRRPRGSARSHRLEMAKIGIGLSRRGRAPRAPAHHRRLPAKRPSRRTMSPGRSKALATRGESAPSLQGASRRSRGCAGSRVTAVTSPSYEDPSRRCAMRRENGGVSGQAEASAASLWPLTRAVEASNPCLPRAACRTCEHGDSRGLESPEERSRFGALVGVFTALRIRCSTDRARRESPQPIPAEGSMTLSRVWRFRRRGELRFGRPSGTDRQVDPLAFEDAPLVSPGSGRGRLDTFDRRATDSRMAPNFFGGRRERPHSPR